MEDYPFIMNKYFKLYMVGLFLSLYIEEGCTTRMVAKDDNNNNLENINKVLVKRLSISNLAQLLKNEQKEDDNSLEEQSNSGLESEATDFSSHIFAPTDHNSDSTLHDHVSSTHDDDSSTFSQATIHQIAQALSKAAEHVAQHHPQNLDLSELDEHHEEIPYQYQYKIKDLKGVDYGHTESKNGKITEGKYFVHLPDGRLKTVSYWADDSGYHADVQYEGKAKHPNTTPMHHPTEGLIMHIPVH